MEGIAIHLTKKPSPEKYWRSVTLNSDAATSALASIAIALVDDALCWPSSAVSIVSVAVVGGRMTVVVVAGTLLRNIVTVAISWMITLEVVVARFPLASVAVHITVVVPSENEVGL